MPVASWVDIAVPLRGIVRGPIEQYDEARSIHTLVLDRLVPQDQRARAWPPAVQRLIALLPARLDSVLRLGRLAHDLTMPIAAPRDGSPSAVEVRPVW